MQTQNAILLSVDEVRPDHLSCYGYDRITTQSIDKLAKDGVLMETCIAPSSFTAICMASVLTSNYPYTHTVRDAFQYIESKTVAEIFKDHDYKTAGFVGVSVLGAKHGFSHGFDHFDEPTKDTCWEANVLEGGDELFFVGNWWVNRMFDWLKENYSKSFFIWGHFLETHDGSEKFLMSKGLIKEGELTEFSYYDAKIKVLDKVLVGPLIKLLQDLGIYENTTIVFMADHGSNLGEHRADFLPHHPHLRYPQHSCAWDCEIKVPLIFKSKGLPKNKRIKGMARSIDVVPTLLELLGICTENLGFEGVNLIPEILQGRVESREAYIENLCEMMRPGAFQAFRTPKYKFIRDVTKATEEFYDLEKDPLEQNNIIDALKTYDPVELSRIRKKLNDYLWRKAQKRAKVFSESEKEEIKSRLRGLGYIK